MIPFVRRPRIKSRCMKLPPPRHPWSLSPKRAIALQERLRSEVLHRRLPRGTRVVAGGDCAFVDGGTRIVACWVVWNLATELVVETASAIRPVRFPYVPGLLSFREAPALLAAARKLHTEPDAFMLDGHGLAHPRRFGIACHVGLLLGRPCLGCAKSLLCGAHDEPADLPGGRAPILHREEAIGIALRTRAGAKPVYVSVGHLARLGDAVQLALACTRGYRLPEPTRLAHIEVTRLTRGG